MTRKRITLRLLRGQYLSALSPSCSKHLPAVRRSHSFAETMFPASLPFLRLECHFHWNCTSFFQAMFCRSFMSTATIIVKKAQAVKKKMKQTPTGTPFFFILWFLKKTFPQKMWIFRLFEIFYPICCRKTSKTAFSQKCVKFFGTVFHCACG